MKYSVIILLIAVIIAGCAQDDNPVYVTVEGEDELPEVVVVVSGYYKDSEDYITSVNALAYSEAGDIIQWVDFYVNSYVVGTDENPSSDNGWIIECHRKAPAILLARAYIDSNHSKLSEPFYVE